MILLFFLLNLILFFPFSNGNGTGFLTTIGKQKLYTCFHVSLPNSTSLCRHYARAFVEACGSKICGNLFGDNCNHPQNKFKCFYLKNKVENGIVRLPLRMLSENTTIRVDNRVIREKPTFFFLSSSLDPFNQYPLGAKAGSLMFARQRVDYGVNISNWWSHAFVNLSTTQNQFFAQIRTDCYVSPLRPSTGWQVNMDVLPWVPHSPPKNYGRSCIVFNFQEMLGSIQQMYSMVNHSVTRPTINPQFTINQLQQQQYLQQIHNKHRQTQPNKLSGWIQFIIGVSLVLCLAIVLFIVAKILPKFSTNHSPEIL